MADKGRVSVGNSFGKLALIMSISVALCTYNGESFLREQLKSVTAQTVRPCEIVVCDDHSSDSTCTIVDNFKKKSHCPVSIYQSEDRLGVVGNYSKALGLCRGDYVALCDQDDIWLPDKLSFLLDAMRKAEQKYGKNIPVLVHSDLKVIDEKGSLLAHSFLKMQKLKHLDVHPLWGLLVQNFVTGCTVLVNRPLLAAALPIPQAAVMHDWWLALVAAALGIIVFVPEPTVLYRQHSKNVVGARRFYSGKNLGRVLRLKEIDNDIAKALAQAFALNERLNALGQKNEDLARLLQGMFSGGIGALKAVREKKIAKQGSLRNLLFYLLLTKAGYKRFL